MIDTIALINYPPDSVDLQTPIYDETADGSKQIADALVLAQKQHKLVLLQFGANWCIWCHVLDHLFHTNRPVRKELHVDYVVVLIDVNNGHNLATVEKYGNPVQSGVPALVLLDPTGKQLVTEEVANFVENDDYSPDKILAFLSHWKTSFPRQ